MRSMKDMVMSMRETDELNAAGQPVDEIKPGSGKDAELKRKILEECTDVSCAGTGSWLAWTCPL